MTGEGKKELLRQIPRVKLWLVLALTGAFTVVLLAAAHITHSLTLRVEAYHALYNLLSLSGCLLTMKLCSGPQSLHNTFGWARLEVLSMLTTLLFLLALCFSVAIESIQTAVHAEHQDAMHHPLSVMALGGVGLCLNALVFALIGGYTHHQGCFLEMRDSGSVWVGRQVTQEAVQAGRRMLSSNDLRARPPHATQVISVLRDALGLVVVEICAAVVHWDGGGTVALYIDPALAVTSAVLLMWLSYPFGRECGHILLQTIPGHIDVENFQTRVLKQFPAIVNVHHLHIWSFTPSKVVATAHLVFSNPRVYLATQPALKQFFMDEGITHVTIQPECITTQSGSSHDPCLLRCQQEKCHERECCPSCSPHPLLTAVTSTHPTTRKRGSSGAATNGCECRDEAEEGRQELTKETRADEDGSQPGKEEGAGEVRGSDPELSRKNQVRESDENMDDVSESRSNESLRKSSEGESDKVGDKVETSEVRSNPDDREEETEIDEDTGVVDVVTVDTREVLEASHKTYYHPLATSAPEEHHDHDDNNNTSWGQQHNTDIPSQHHNTNLPCQQRNTNTSQDSITNTSQHDIDSSQMEINTIQQDITTNQQDLTTNQQDITTRQQDINTSQQDINTSQQHSRDHDTTDEADETTQLLTPSGKVKNET